MKTEKIKFIYPIAIAVVCVFVFINVQTNNLPGSHDANLYNSSGLNSDVYKTSLYCPVNICSYCNSVYVATCEIYFSSTMVAAFNMNEPVVTMNNISGTISDFISF